MSSVFGNDAISLTSQDEAVLENSNYISQTNSISQSLVILDDQLYHPPTFNLSETTHNACLDFLADNFINSTGNLGTRVDDLEAFDLTVSTQIDHKIDANNILLDSQYYPLSTNPSNYVTSSALTPYRTAVAEDLINDTFYLKTNPDNFVDITTVNDAITDNNTLLDTLYYPISSNPEGYVTSSDLNTTLSSYRTNDVQDIRDTGQDNEIITKVSKNKLRSDLVLHKPLYATECILFNQTPQTFKFSEITNPITSSEIYSDLNTSITVTEICNNKPSNNTHKMQVLARNGNTLYYSTDGLGFQQSGQVITNINKFVGDTDRNIIIINNNNLVNVYYNDTIGYFGPYDSYVITAFFHNGFWYVLSNASVYVDDVPITANIGYTGMLQHYDGIGIILTKAVGSDYSLDGTLTDIISISVTHPNGAVTSVNDNYVRQTMGPYGMMWWNQDGFTIFPDKADFNSYTYTNLENVRKILFIKVDANYEYYIIVKNAGQEEYYINDYVNLTGTAYIASGNAVDDCFNVYKTFTKDSISVKTTDANPVNTYDTYNSIQALSDANLFLYNRIAVMARSNIRYVDTTTGAINPKPFQAYSTITSALNGFSNGTILLFPGIHSVSSSITLANVTLRGADRYQTIVNFGVGAGCILNNGYLSDITLNFTNSGATAYNMITFLSNSGEINNSIINGSVTSTGTNNLIFSNMATILTDPTKFHVKNCDVSMVSNASSNKTLVHTGAGQFRVDGSQIDNTLGGCCENSNGELVLTNCFISGSLWDLNRNSGTIMLGKSTVLANANSNSTTFNTYGNSIEYYFNKQGNLNDGFFGIADIYNNPQPFRISKKTIIYGLYFTARLGTSHQSQIIVYKNGVATALLVDVLNVNNLSNTTIAVTFDIGDILTVRAQDVAGTATDITVQLSGY